MEAGQSYSVFTKSRDSCVDVGGREVLVDGVWVPIVVANSSG